MTMMSISKSLPALSQSFSVPAMSATIVRSECPGEWRRFVKIPPNILEPQREKSDSVEGLVALKTLEKENRFLRKI